MSKFSPEKFVTDSSSFADTESGLLPYLAKCVKAMIRLEDDDALKHIVADIEFVSDALKDLNDEISVVRDDYLQMRNKRDAIRQAVEERRAAEEAIEAEMAKKFGISNKSADLGDDELIDSSIENDDTELANEIDELEEDNVSIDELMADISDDDEAALDDLIIPGDDAADNPYDALDALNFDETEDGELGTLKDAGLFFDDDIDSILDDSLDEDIADLGEYSGLTNDIDLGEDDKISDIPSYEDVSNNDVIADDPFALMDDDEAIPESDVSSVFDDDDFESDLDLDTFDDDPLEDFGNDYDDLGDIDNEADYSSDFGDALSNDDFYGENVDNIDNVNDDFGDVSESVVEEESQQPKKHKQKPINPIDTKFIDPDIFK